jgi:dipeptidyl aminopeptidase/acylaminoacyl peptidase
MAFLRLITAVFVLAFVPAVSARPSVEDFFAFPAMQRIALSPSGKYMATIQGVDGGNDEQRVVGVYDTDTGARISLTPSGKAKIFDVYWFNDDRVVIVGGILKEEKFPGRDFVYNDTRAIVMNRDGSQPLSIIFTGQILSLKGREPDTILVSASNFVEKNTNSAVQTGPRRSNDIYSVNMKTGAFVAVEKGNDRTIGWVIDKNLEARVRVESDGRNQKPFARLSGSKDWFELPTSRLMEVEDKDNTQASGFTVIGFGDNLNEAYVTTSDGDKAILAVYDLAQRKIVRNVLQDPKWDAGGFIVQRGARVIGGNIDRWKPEQVYFVPEWQSLQQQAKAAYPGYDVRISSVSEDRSKAVLYIEGPDAPSGIYQFVDFAKGDGFIAGKRYPKINRGDTGEVRTVTFKARDGVDIDAYITLPPGSAGKNLAAIVLPHGGPEARDTGGYEQWSQFLANRGYAVIQPQFRGSDGYGRKFREIARFQWGLTMQDDVSDAVKYLIDNGIADPKRVCIFGWSYGGYAAMAGATITPELYRCSIAGAGVSDLIKILDEEVGGDSNNFAFRYWRRVIGNVRDHFPRLQKTSAARNADKVAGPMLLIHGTLDTVVRINQSEFMADALKAAGKPYEFVRLEGEDHNLSFLKTRVQTFKAVEAFLLKHNPPN